MPNDGGATWKSYGKAFGSSNSWITKLWSSIALCQSRSKYARKEKQRGKASKVKRSKEDSSCSLLSHFWSTSRSPFFYMIYTISKLWKSRIQRFKPCMIWSWNEEDMAFGRQLLQVCENFAHPLSCANGVRNSHTFFRCVKISHTPCVVQILLCFCRPHFRYFPMYFFDVISFLILVTNQSQAFAFVKTI